MLLRFIVSGKGVSSEEERAVYGGLPIIAGSVIAYIVFMFFLNRLVSFPFFPYVLVFGLLNKAVDIYGAVTRGLGRSLVFAVSSLLYAVTAGLFNVVLLVVLRMGLEALFIAAIAGFLVQLAYYEGVTGLARGFRLRKVDVSLTARMLAYAAPFCLNVTAYWVLSRYSRIAISRGLSVSDNGLYAVAMGVSTVLAVLARNFLLSWQEAAFSVDGEMGERGRYFTEATSTLVKILTALFVLMLPLVWLVFPLLIGEAYQQARAYVPLALIATVMYSLDLFFGSMHGNLFENRLVVASTVTGAAICLAILGPMVGALGVDGASLAVSLGFGASAGIKVVFLRRKLGLRLGASRLGFCALCVVLSCGAYFTDNLPAVLASLVLLPGAAALLLRNELRLMWASARNRPVAKG